MDNKTKVQALLVVGFIILIAGAFYLCYPKYEIYQSAGDGTVTYRFNKITGHLQWADYNRVWNDAVPSGFIKRP